MKHLDVDFTISDDARTVTVTLIWEDGVRALEPYPVPEGMDAMEYCGFIADSISDYIRSKGGKTILPLSQQYVN